MKAPRTYDEHLKAATQALHPPPTDWDATRWALAIAFQSNRITAVVMDPGVGAGAGGPLPEFVAALRVVCDDCLRDLTR